MNNKLIFNGTVGGLKDGSFTDKVTGVTTKSRKFKFMIENEDDISVMEFKIPEELDNKEAVKGSRVQFDVSVSSFENKLFYKAVSQIKVIK